MYQYLTKLRKKLETGSKPYGALLELDHPRILDAVCGSGMHFVILDNEKGIFDDKSLQKRTKATLVDYRMPALVRTQNSSLEAVAKVENLHTAGLIVPQVTELDQVTALINEYKTFPLGLKYQDLIPHDPLTLQTLERWNEQFLLFLECDSPFLYDNLETITAWEGVDGIYVRPHTLYTATKAERTISMLDIPDMLNHIKSICKERGKYCMFYETGDGSDIASRLTWGHYDAVVCRSDFQLLRDSYLSISSTVNKILSGDDD